MRGQKNNPTNRLTLLWYVVYFMRWTKPLDYKRRMNMVDAAIDITYRTMLKHCPGLLAWAESLGYEREVEYLV